jgi:methylenetetrahydrofolate reductase (NADPH)
MEEAYSIWGEWQRLYPPRSPTAKLLQQVKEDVWLVNIIHHAYVEKDALWNFLLEESGNGV